MLNCGEIIQQIEHQISILLDMRSIFPTLTNDIIGLNSYATAPFYEKFGYKIEARFSSPITEEYIDKHNNIGRWVNQGFIIRLCAILERNGILPKEDKGKINQEIDGWNEIDLVRRIRNKLVHKNGEYNPRDPDDRKLYETIVEQFQLKVEKPENAREFPVPIDKLLLPLANGCIKYINGIKN